MRPGGLLLLLLLVLALAACAGAPAAGLPPTIVSPPATVVPPADGGSSASEVAVAPTGPIVDGLAAWQSALDAFRHHDWIGYQRALRLADTFLPRQPGLARRLAGAAVARGDTVEAFRWLGRLAAYQVNVHLETDSLLAPLRSHPAFGSVLTAMAGIDTPMTSSEVAAEIATKGLITEGLTWDDRARHLLLGSVRRREVFILDAERRLQPFAPAADDTILAPLGMTTDGDRNSLWVASAAVPEMAGYDSTLEGRTELLQIDLTDGRVRRRWRPPPDGVVHSFNDLALDPRGGAIYLSDSRGGAIYRLAGDEDEALAVVAPPGTFTSPGGLVVTDDGRWLFVADYGVGLFVLDAASGVVIPAEAPESVCLNGIDGLVPIPGGMVAIQNGILPNRLLRLQLDANRPRIARATLLDRNHPLWDEPTLGVYLNREVYYVARSQWGRILPGGRMPPEDQLEPHLIMRVRVN